MISLNVTRKMAIVRIANLTDAQAIAQMTFFKMRQVFDRLTHLYPEFFEDSKS